MTGRHSTLFTLESGDSGLGFYTTERDAAEIHALINILLDIMNLISPRPLLMQYIPPYNTEQARCCDVKSGFSGWAQSNGRNTLYWEPIFSLDVWYVDHQSFWIDLTIFLIAGLNVIRRYGISVAGEAIIVPSQ